MSQGCTVGDVYDIVDRFAPFESAMEWDNVGLLVGRKTHPVDTVLTALDVTLDVVREAAKMGAQLIVAHHPLMFSPIKRLDESNAEAAVLCEMIRGGIAMIAAHTNLDIAAGGVGDALAAQVGWAVSEGTGVLRFGQWSEDRRLEDIQAGVADALNAQVIRYGPADRRLARFAICAGAGGSEAREAWEAGAQVLLTGEIKHNEALEAVANGMSILAAGHRPTEICAAELLRKHLQLSLDAVKLRVRVFASKADPFA